MSKRVVYIEVPVKFVLDTEAPMVSLMDATVPAENQPKLLQAVFAGAWLAEDIDAILNRNGTWAIATLDIP